MKIHLEAMMGSLNAMMGSLESNVTKSFSNMGNDQAIEFAKAMENAKISEKLEEIKQVSKNLKNDLNIK